MINPGRLNKKVSILEPSGTTVNEAGENVPCYTHFKTVHAEITPLTGREYAESQKIRSETTYKVTIRYFPGIKSDMRIQYKDLLLEIVSVLNIGYKNRVLQLMCIENDKDKGESNAE